MKVFRIFILVVLIIAFCMEASAAEMMGDSPTPLHRGCARESEGQNQTSFDGDKIRLVRRGCCSWHGGVCGCDWTTGRTICCDGTLSPTCMCD